MDLIKQAKTMLGKGYACFPLGVGSKKPIPGSNGLKDATTDPDEYQRLCQLYGAGPNNNYAVVPRDDDFILDLDVKGRPNGLDWAEGLTNEQSTSIMEAIGVVTPSSGRHGYYRSDVPVKQSAGKIAPGVDVRTSKGYVVGPGCILTGGGEYVVRGMVPCRADLPVAPAWLVELASADATPAQPASEPASPGRDPIPEGQRNNTLTQIAGSLRNAGLSTKAIYAALNEVNAERCVPMLPYHEIDLIARSSENWDINEVALLQAENHFSGETARRMVETGELVDPLEGFLNSLQIPEPEKAHPLESVEDGQVVARTGDVVVEPGQVVAVTPLPPNAYVEAVKLAVNRQEGADTILSAEDGQAVAGSPLPADEPPEPLPVGAIEGMPPIMRSLYDTMWDHSDANVPELCLGATLALLGTVYCQKVKAYSWGTMTNQYMIGLADTAVGKNGGLEVIHNLLMEVNHCLLGPGEIGSHIGINNLLKEGPCLMPIDEMGDEIAKWSKDTGGTVGQAILRKLTQIYTASKMPLWKPIAVKNRNDGKGIPFPCLNIWGATTFDQFYDGMRSKAVGTGFLGRLMLFETRPHGPDREKEVKPIALSQALIDHCKAWAPNLENGYVQDPDDPDALNEGPILEHANGPDPQIINWEPDAWLRHREICRRTKLKMGSESPRNAAIWGRTAEKVCKLAMIRECSRARPGDPIWITMDTENWANNIVCWNNRMMARSGHKIADSEQRLVLGYCWSKLPARGGWMKFNAWSDKVRKKLSNHNTPPRRVMEILEEYGYAELRSIKSGGRECCRKDDFHSE